MPDGLTEAQARAFSKENPPLALYSSSLLPSRSIVLCSSLNGSPSPRARDTTVEGAAVEGDREGEGLEGEIQADQIPGPRRVAGCARQKVPQQRRRGPHLLQDEQAQSGARAAAPARYVGPKAELSAGSPLRTAIRLLRYFVLMTALVRVDVTDA